MDDETWTEVVKLVDPGIIKMAVRNVDFFLLYFILYFYNSLYLNLASIYC